MNDQTWVTTTKGRRVLIDTEDLSLFKYDKFYNGGSKSLYTTTLLDSKKVAYIHRIIMKAGKGVEVDHINGKKWDNRKVNLRIVNRRQNMANSGAHCNSSLGYVGVSRDRDKGFMARIRHDGKRIYLGSFHTAEEASKAYNSKAIELRGEYVHSSVEAGL